ncbi:MAG: hypothetical protein E7456_03450 [Ruminococcaceae bacterium]|nr:hypothetical protein [Oscillospiraceae bacterium]
MENQIMGLAGAAVLSMLAISATPEGRVKKAVKLICGFAVILSILCCFADFDFSFYSKSIADHRRDAEKLIEEELEERSLLERQYIESRCEAYILDKAAELKVNCRGAEVTLKWSAEGYWYPTAVWIEAECDPELADFIEAELGIPEDSQKWSKTNG